MRIDHKTGQALQHTLHCLIGCGIGEVAGMIIASQLGWDKFGRIALAIALAFCFGYALTYRSVRKHARSAGEAMKITAATDTVSIATMEIVGNAMELLLPGALMATITMPVFWWGLVLSMAIAFVVTVPVNRFMIARNPHTHHHHG